MVVDVSDTPTTPHVNYRVTRTSGMGQSIIESEGDKKRDENSWEENSWKEEAEKTPGKKKRQKTTAAQGLSTAGRLAKCGRQVTSNDSRSRVSG